MRLWWKHSLHLPYFSNPATDPHEWQISRFQQQQLNFKTIYLQKEERKFTKVYRLAYSWSSPWTFSTILCCTVVCIPKSAKHVLFTWHKAALATYIVKAVDSESRQNSYLTLWLIEISDLFMLADSWFPLSTKKFSGYFTLNASTRQMHSNDLFPLQVQDKISTWFPSTGARLST